MTVSGGGSVTAGTVNVGAYGEPGASGTLTVAGGTFACDRLYIGGYTVGSDGTGTVTVGDGAVLGASGGVTVYSDGTLTGAGAVQADVLNGGTVAPGTSPGVLLIQGDYTQTADGLLEVELCGGVPGDEYDVLLVTGTADLDGVLEVLLIDGFSPSYGQTFTIVGTGGGVGSQFSGTKGPVMDVTYNPDHVAITVTCQGDANFDGLVDGGDFTLWADSYGQSGGWGDGDFNGDDTIDGGDFTLWADNYGTGTGVPEPGALAVLAAGGLLLRRRKR
jgi:hypothetical protein